MTRTRLPVAVLPVAMLLLASTAPPAPAAAQEAALRAGCTREVKQAPEAERPKKPAEARRAAARERVRTLLSEVVARHTGEGGIDAPQGVLVFGALKDRSGAEIRVAETNLPDDALARLQDDPALRFDWPKEVDPYMEVRIDSVPLPQIAVGEWTTGCTPELLHREQISRSLSDLVRDNPHLVRPRRQQVTIDFLVTRDGKVLAPHVERSSGNRQLDDFALGLVPRLAFRPAEVDGVAVDTWSRIPFTIEASARARKLR